MTRNYLVSALLLGLLTACSSVNMGTHRIDVQQGNALDQESVAKLKLGLNRSQVRFLLGTPLVVDPFRNDRWDYVYIFYKAGKLADQKRITLFFDGDILKRIEGDVPAAEPVIAKVDAPKPVPVVVAPTPTESVPPAPVPKSISAAKPAAEVKPVAADKPFTASVVVPVVAMTEAKPAPVPSEPVAVDKPESYKVAETPRTPVATSIVAPLPSPKGAPAYVDPRPPAELGLQTETNVAQIQPDVIPPFPEPNSAAPTNTPVPANAEEAVLQALKIWSEAWGQRNEEAYIAAYAQDFVPQGGGTRADWEKRRRLLLGLAKNIELKIESPSVEMAPDGSALVTLNQHYRSDSFRDAVVKQIRMAQRDGRWLIVEERVISILHPRKPLR